MDALTYNWNKLGEFVSHRVEKIGRTVIVVFEYTRGEAKFDGREWSFVTATTNV